MQLSHAFVTKPLPCKQLKVIEKQGEYLTHHINDTIVC